MSVKKIIAVPSGLNLLSSSSPGLVPEWDPGIPVPGSVDIYVEGHVKKSSFVLFFLTKLP